MRRFAAVLIYFTFLSATPCYAALEDYPSVKLQGLDKSVGRTVTFEAEVGATIQYGPLFIKIHACRKAPPIETPESAAFLQIWEVPPGAEKSEWVFSGWMFASSPALSAMDHAVYDIWVLECTGREEELPPSAQDAAESAEGAAETVTLEEQESAPVPAQDIDFMDDSGVSIPDAEAEDQTLLQTAPLDQGADRAADQAVGIPADGTASYPGSYPGPLPETALDPATQIPPSNPQDDPGFTVYDLLRQGGGRVPANP